MTIDLVPRFRVDDRELTALHAFLLDTAVDPDRQRHGVGARLVGAAVAEARSAGCDWLHVDFEPRLRHFCLDRCGFRATDAGLLSLRTDEGSTPHG